jgi:hypothetical protein
VTPDTAGAAIIQGLEVIAGRIFRLREGANMTRRHHDHAPCREALRWLRARGWDLAPLTGQDRPALEAVAHCWALWGRSDADGQRAAIGAIAALVGGMQAVAWPMARELAAQALDWGHRGRLWPQVAAEAIGRVSPSALLTCHVGHPCVRTPDEASADLPGALGVPFVDGDEPSTTSAHDTRWRR